MITSPLLYLLLLTGIAGLLLTAQEQKICRCFRYLPAIVMLYFGVMLLSSFGLWDKSDAAVTQSYKSAKTLLLPAMIFLLLLDADLRKIAHLGLKMIAVFFLATLSIIAGFTVMYALLHHLFPVDAWKAFGALSGSWMGGTGNMVAIQGALDLPDSAMGYVLLIDSIDYALWVMLLLAAVPFAKRFNARIGADTEAIDATLERLTTQSKEKIETSSGTLLLFLALSLAVSTLSHALALQLPHSAFLSTSAWTVIVATLLGILAALTPLGCFRASETLGNAMLYLIVALIASRANFGELIEAPLYIAAGLLILAVHAGLMLLFAKRFKIDLFTLGVASLANIGGVASAPILASAYNKALIPVGVLMAMLGYIVGTFGGLMTAKLLAFFA